MKMKPRWFSLRNLLFLVLLGGPLFPSALPAVEEGAGSPPAETRMTLEVRGEDREVGLRRMEILEKALSPELIERKRAFVRSQEQDYNEKIGLLLQRLTTNIGRNTVITHIDVDYFVVGFEQDVQAVENVHVTVLLDEDGLAKWASGKPSQEAALEEIQAMIHGSFGIPLDRIRIVSVPN